MLRYGCPCLNITLHLASEGGIEDGADWLETATQGSQWKKCTMGMAGSRIKFDVLSSTRTLNHGWQMWTLYHCENCNTDTHIVPVGGSAAAASSPAAAVSKPTAPPSSPSRPASRGFFSALQATFFDSPAPTAAPAPPTSPAPAAPAAPAAGLSVWMNAALSAAPDQPSALAGYSAVFGIVIAAGPPSSSAADEQQLAPEPGDAEAAAQFAAHSKTLQQFLAAEQQAMKDRIAAYEQQEQQRFAATQARAQQDRKLLWHKLQQVRHAKRQHKASQSPVQPASVAVVVDAAPPPPSAGLPQFSPPPSPQQRTSVDDSEPAPPPPPTVTVTVTSAPQRGRAPSQPAPPPPTKTTVAATTTRERAKSVDGDSYAAVFDLDGFAEQDSEAKPDVDDIDDIDDDDDDTAANNDDDDKNRTVTQHRVSTAMAASISSANTTPQFQACSLPIPVPERFTNWKPKPRAPRQTTTSSSTSSSSPTSSSTVLSSPTAKQTTIGDFDDDESIDAAMSNIVPAVESDSDDDKFIMPHQLIIEQEEADELSRSFAVPLSLTRMRPGFL